MCGIVGIIGKGEATPHLVEGLKRLEYRGYDSSGIATIHNGQITRARSEGKIKNLEAVLQDNSPQGTHMPRKRLRLCITESLKIIARLRRS
jgi:glucosamine--fructose-6-phosphate aminotransferase (isomerizing)